MALQFGELDAVVGAQDFHGVLRLRGGHAQAVRHGHGDDVGEVVLALGILVRQAAEPAGQAFPRHCQDAGIALADRALLGGSVLLLDDRPHLAGIVAQDPAVAGRVGQFHGEQGQLLRGGLLQQAFQGRLLDQRHVAIENQHPLGLEERQRLRHGVAGAELLGLQHEVDVVRRQALAYPLRTVPDHHMDTLGRQVARGIDHMGQHRFAGDGMEDLRQGRAHAGALAGGENDDFEGHGRAAFLVHTGETRGVEKEKG
ncbi:hypothetical protein D3C76_1036250 [compost metagenome]